MAIPDPIGAASRETRRKRRLGDQDFCALCGESRTPVLLEVDHYIGENIEPEGTWVLCRNCHAVDTARRKDLGLSMAEPETGFDWLVAVIGGLGRMLTVIGEHLLLAAQWLSTAQTGLDERYPGWRDQPWAVRP